MPGQPRLDSPTGLPECDSEAVRTLGLLKSLRSMGSRRARAREPLARPGLESSRMRATMGSGHERCSPGRRAPGRGDVLAG
eukprot:13056098-Alexandrium_andersonii.AAC.1